MRKMLITLVVVPKNPMRGNWSGWKKYAAAAGESEWGSRGRDSQRRGSARPLRREKQVLQTDPIRRPEEIGRKIWSSVPSESARRVMTADRRGPDQRDRVASE